MLHRIFRCRRRRKCRAACCLALHLEEACFPQVIVGQKALKLYPMSIEAVDKSSSPAEQRGHCTIDKRGRRTTRAAPPVLPVLLLFGVCAALVLGASALAVDTKLLRRGRRHHASSRTLSDHSTSSMPQGFYSRSSDVSGPHALHPNCIHHPGMNFALLRVYPRGFAHGCAGMHLHIGRRLRFSMAGLA